MRASPRLDFQEHLADLERAGLLVRVDRPINKDTELHPLVRWQFIGGTPEEERKAFLFTNVTDGHGRKFDIPVVVGALAASPRIYAMGMHSNVEDIGSVWLDAIANPIPPVVIAKPPCQEVVMIGDDMKGAGNGLERLPVPISTPGFDAAPYLTATLCTSRDPDTGVQNMGTYRAALKAPDRLAVRMVARVGGAGGYVHWLKYHERKQEMPFAIVLGAAPVVVFTGPQKLSRDQDELSVAGGLAGQAIPVAKCVTNDLMVPANAEIVIEGFIDTQTLEPEGPFGESHGYVAPEGYNMPMRVTAITHKKNPVFVSIISQVTPSESCVIKKVAYEPLFLDHLRSHLGVQGIKRVVMHEPLSNLRPVIFLQFSHGTNRAEVRRGLQGASSFKVDCGKFVIAVSEDIDPANTDAVVWSLAYRCKPAEDMHIISYRAPGHEPAPGERTDDSGVLIDATLKHVMPPLALPRREFMENARKIWEELGFAPITQCAPWHGYSLGDWPDGWAEAALAASLSNWQDNGLRTFADRVEADAAAGLMPEAKTRRTKQ